MTPASDAAQAYARTNGDKFLDELKEMLRIPSLNGDPAEVPADDKQSPAKRGRKHKEAV
jgi:hypothetical protein